MGRQVRCSSILIFHSTFGVVMSLHIVAFGRQHRFATQNPKLSHIPDCFICKVLYSLFYSYNILWKFILYFSLFWSCCYKFIMDSFENVGGINLIYRDACETK